MGTRVPFRELSVEAFAKHRKINKAAANEFLARWEVIDKESHDAFSKGAAIKAARFLIQKECHAAIDDKFSIEDDK